MKNAHGVNLESKADQLLQLNRQIFECAQRGSELICAGERPERVNIEIDTLRTLFSRRDMVLREFKKKGGKEKDLYFREVPECTG